jgi:hypothetical protein
VAPATLWYSKISVGELEQELENNRGRRERLRGRGTPLGSHGGKAITGISCQVERRVVTVTEIFVFKRFQPVLFGLFKFDPEITFSVIDPMNLQYRLVIAVKKGICEPVANNLVTAN